MRKAWKVILYIALAILIIGELILGVGLLLGGSPERVWDTLYDHYDGDAIIETWNTQIQPAYEPIAEELGLQLPTIEVLSDETPEPTATPAPTATPTPKPTATPAPSAEPSAAPTATANP